MGALFDLFGGSATDPGTLYGGLLAPEQKQALAYRGLLAAAGAFGQAAMPHDRPVPIGAALGTAAAAMGSAQDEAGLNAMRGQLLGLQGKELQAKIGVMGGLGTPPPPPPGGSAPASGGSASASGGGLLGSPAPGAKVSDGGIGAGQLYGFLTQNGATPNEAAMLTSAANSESSFRPDITHDGGIGYGLFGHNTDRLQAMYKFAGLDPNSPPGTPVPWQTQALFALNELHGSEGKAGAMVNAATTPDQLTDAQLAFERPNLNIAGGNRAQRLASTREYMASPPGGRPTQVAQADTGTATDAFPDVGYGRAGLLPGLGLSGGGGPTGASSSTTPQALAPTGQPSAAPVNTMRPGGALSMPALTARQGLLAPPPTMEEHAAGLLGFPDHPAASPPAPQPTATPFTNAPPINGVGAPAPGPQSSMLPPQAPQAAQMPPRVPAPAGAPVAAPVLTVPASATSPGTPGVAPGRTDAPYIAWAQDQVRRYNILGMTPPPDLVAAATLPYVGPKASAEAAAQAPYKFNRPGSSAPIYGPGGNIIGYNTTPAAPQIMEVYNPGTGQYERAQVTPGVNGQAPTVTPVPGMIAKPGPQTQAFGTRSGENQANNTPMPSPGAPSAPGAEQQPIAGTPLTYRMDQNGNRVAATTSVVPQYAPPQYTQNQLEANKELWAKGQGDLSSSYGDAQVAEQRLMALASVYQKLKTGSLTTEMGEANALLKRAFGDNAVQLGSADPAKVEEAVHTMFISTLNTLKASTNRFTQMEVRSLNENSPNPDLQPEANLAMLSQSIAILRRDMARSGDYNAAGAGGTRFRRPRLEQPIIKGGDKDPGDERGKRPCRVSDDNDERKSEPEKIVRRSHGDLRSFNPLACNQRGDERM